MIPSLKVPLPLFLPLPGWKQSQCVKIGEREARDHSNKKKNCYTDNKYYDIIIFIKKYRPFIGLCSYLFDIFTFEETLFFDLYI